jgi:hypothetical protein
LFRRLPSQYKVSLHLLEIAYTILKSLPGPPDEHSWTRLATTYYNIGCRMYKAEKWREAARVLEVSCQLFKQCRLDKANPETAHHLSRQYESLAACYCTIKAYSVSGR